MSQPQRLKNWAHDSTDAIIQEALRMRLSYNEAMDDVDRLTRERDEARRLAEEFRNKYCDPICSKCRLPWEGGK